jgi:hypothetical protein
MIHTIQQLLSAAVATTKFALIRNLAILLISDHYWNIMLCSENLMRPMILAWHRRHAVKPNIASGGSEINATFG